MLMILAGPIGAASWALIFTIIALVFLALAAFTGPVAADGPFYRRIGFGWAGMFFFVLAWAFSG